MGKYLWRKHSYVRVEDEHPGCIWTIFHMLNYHPWHNVRKMLPYKKHKVHGKSSKNRGIMPEEEHQIISRTHEFEDDSILKYSASVSFSYFYEVNSNTSTNGSTSKRSIKARIRALMKEKNSSTKSDLAANESKSKRQKGKWDDDNNAPTLMDLLKANPKLLRSVSRIDDSNYIMKPETKDSKNKDEFVGVLELFNVDKDLFIKILQDTSPRKPRLVKSGTFPSRNSVNISATPSKVEEKHNEIWPVSNVTHELQKAKSQGVLRSSSLTDSLGKFGYLFDTSSNKAIKKHLSKSSKSMNEKEFAFYGDLQSPRVKEKLDLPESMPHSLTTTETLSRAISERENNNNGGVGLLKFESTKGCENFVESESDENATWYVFEDEQVCQETNDKVQSQEGEFQTTECSISEELQFMSNITSTSSRKMEDPQDTVDEFSFDYNNQDLQYVKHVLDIVDFATLEDQHEALHSQDQQLDPALFDMIEVCCPFEPKSSNKDTHFHMSSAHRKFLFDLINEALLNIHDKSYTYYPKALSSWCQVHPMGKQKIHNSEEVWVFVEEYLSWRPDLDPSLDLAVANDLSRNKNGWVNLQMDTEDLALELEDWIFDDLLDEIVDQIVCF